MDLWQLVSSIIPTVLAGIISYILFQQRRSTRLVDENNKREHQYLENYCKEKLGEAAKRFENIEAMQRHMHDKWESFLRDYLKIENTRGNKIDALFRVVDNLTETTRQLRSEMHAIKELEESVRDLQLKLVKIETIMNGGRHER